MILEVQNIRTITLTAKGQIAIPKDIRKQSGIKVGAKVAVISYKDRIEIRPLAFVSEKMAGAYASEKVLAKDWNKEDDAWKDL